MGSAPPGEVEPLSDLDPRAAVDRAILHAFLLHPSSPGAVLCVGFVGGSGCCRHCWSASRRGARSARSCPDPGVVLHRRRTQPDRLSTPTPRILDGPGPSSWCRWACSASSPGMFIVALIPVLRTQINTLIDNVPAYLDDLRNKQGSRHRREVRRHRYRQGQGRTRLRANWCSAASSPRLGCAERHVQRVPDLRLPYLLRRCPSSSSPHQLAPARARISATYRDEILRQVGGYVAGQFLVAVCRCRVVRLPRDHRPAVRRRAGVRSRSSTSSRRRSHDRCHHRYLDRVRETGRMGHRASSSRGVTSVRELCSTRGSCVHRSTYWRAHRDRGCSSRAA